MICRGAILLAVLFISSAQPATLCECPPVRQFPGGVVDAASQIAFVAVPGNATQAVNLRTGTQTWTSQLSSLPVALTATTLLGLRRGDNPRDTQLVTLHRRDGKQLSVSPPFRLNGEALGSDLLSATLFSFHQDGSGGALEWVLMGQPVVGIERSVEPTTRGMLRIHADQSVEPVQNDSNTRIVRTQSATYRRGSAWISGSWELGSCIRDLVVEQEDRSLAVSLLCGTSAAGSGTTVHRLTKQASVALTVSIDGCHVFVESPGENGGSVWQVFSAATASKLATVPKEPGAWNPAVVGDRLYYIIDAAPGKTTGVLKAVGMSTGTTLWELSVRTVAQKNRLPQ